MKSKLINPALTVDEIVRGMLECQLNAKELVDETVLLAAHGRHARAFTLAHTACEELAKFFILELAGKRIVQNNPPDWPRFWKRFRAHGSKIAQFNLQLLCFIEERSPHKKDLLEAARKLFELELLPRNASLYVDRNQLGEFRKPSDMKFDIVLPILQEVALLALKVANDGGSDEEGLKSNLQRPPSDTSKAAAVAVFIRQVQKMKEDGQDRDEVHKIIEKYMSSSI